MLSFLKLCGTVLAVFALITLPALADDWVAVKLRGLVYQLVDGHWERLDRRDVVPDSRVIRTAANSSAVFQRGEESITLAANTQIQIFDKAGAQKYTTVHEHFGTVAIEAEVQNVQHFEVDTPYLAAVVKGTKFIVTSGRDGASVEVTRGKVQVTDRHTDHRVLVKVGETATVVPEDGTTVLSLVNGAGAVSVINAVAATVILPPAPDASAVVNGVLTETGGLVNTAGNVVNGLLGGDDDDEDEDEDEDGNDGNGNGNGGGNGSSGHGKGSGSNSSGSNNGQGVSGGGGLGGLLGGLL